MAQVPLRGAGFRGGLDDLVLDRKRRRELERRVAHRPEPFGEEGTEAAFPPCWVDEQALFALLDAQMGVLRSWCNRCAKATGA